MDCPFKVTIPFVHFQSIWSGVYTPIKHMDWPPVFHEVSNIRFELSLVAAESR